MDPRGFAGQRKWTTLARNVIVVSVENPTLERFDDRTVGEIADERGEDPNDTFFDGSRLYCKAEGIAHVIVNGQTLYRDGKPTAARAGKVLRPSA